MKKLWCALLACCLLAGSVGCGPAAEPEEMLLTAEQSFDDLAAGEYAAVVGRMSAACAGQLSEEALKKAWTGMTETIGAFVERTHSANTQSNGITVVTVTGAFTSRELAAQFTFNRSGQIDGLWLSYGKTIEQPLEAGEGFTEYSIKLGSRANQVSGKLTLPDTVEEKPPVVILIQGSGQSDMDETIGRAGNKPFRDLAHGLAKQGIATIRFDKRWFAFPEEAQKLGTNVTIEDEVIKDVTAAIELAETDPRVDNQRIYLLGHSLGGMLVPKVAYDNPSVKGIISMAGSLRGLEDIILDQNREALDGAGLTEEQKKEQLQKVEAEVRKVKDLAGGKKIAGTIFGQPTAYWASLNNARGEDYAKRLTIPMLVLQGQSDFQVSVAKDYQSWLDALLGKENLTSWVYGGLNHLMMQSSGARDISDYDAPNHVEQRVIDDICDWVQTH